ncbi:hypothetical protein DFP72DRAFT_843918 [Ephemerocybe angulata]|uniref:Uncharacterized protein n=1 Tax=Ephemerocybe angulata TaxID=980116 RepID=A0A8H6MD89_9AGAR|nr:hypothetical protein DFP72DRAFT_843918 [Tulosesus angulatus]
MDRRLSVDLRDESLLDALSSSYPSFLQGNDPDRKVIPIRPDENAFSPNEDDDVAMIHPSIPIRSEAGSSTSGLRSRSRSLFSLTLSSRPNSTPLTTPSTTTSPMITVARSLTRRISSTTPLRAQHVQTHDSPEAKKSLSQDDDAFSVGSDRSLRRKKRMNPPPPPFVPGPGLASRKVSTASLKSQPPIAITLRPGTADSGTSSRRDASPQPEQRTPEQVSPTRTVRWSVDEKQDRPEAPPPIVLPEVPPPVPVQQLPRLGHPSRPYYSAIRKHCMSSPASSRPSSIDQTAAPPLPITSRSRPTSTSVPPSAFNMTSVTPFTRRPVSIGAVPLSVPAASTSIPARAAPGLSVFEIADETFEEEEDEKPEPHQRKSSSLSRAFGRRLSQSKLTPTTKKRWSASSLFAEGSSRDYASPVEAKHTSRGPEMGSRMMGISMSGEIEMRMSLAMRQQQEEGQAAGVSPQREGSQERGYRFRRTLEQAAAGNGGAGLPSTEGGAEREGRSEKRKGQSNVLARIKRGLKKVF